MKKVISLLMIISIMMLSIGTAFAWDYETVDTGVNVTAVEDENGLITLTVKGTDTKAVGSYTIYLTLSGVKLVNSASDLTEASASSAIVMGSDVSAIGWKVKDFKYTSAANILVTVGADNLASLTPNATEVFKAYFVKTTDEKLSETAFEYATGRQTKSVISYADASTNDTRTSGQTKYFGIDVTPATTVTTVDKWETSAAPEGWTAPAALEGEVRRVAVFGKNATAKALEANSYGVTFGANTYYGGATTEAVNAWAIVLVDTEGDLIKAGYEYTGTAFVGTTNWSVTVSAN